MKRRARLRPAQLKVEGPEEAEGPECAPRDTEGTSDRGRVRDRRSMQRSPRCMVLRGRIRPRCEEALHNLLVARAGREHQCSPTWVPVPALDRVGVLHELAGSEVRRGAMLE